MNCGYCDAEIIVEGRRIWEPPGFPYLHECPPPVLRVPNERDFCPLCHALTWGGLCDECGAKKPALKKALRKAPAKALAKGRVVRGIDLE